MYYLYRHIRLDKNEVFYIGIGTCNLVLKNRAKNFTHQYVYKRAYDKVKSRSEYWKNIIAKTDYLVEIMLEDGNIEFIKQKEIEFVNLYGRKNIDKGTLCNLTDGGYGINSFVHTNEAKTKIGNAFRGKQLSNEHKKLVHLSKIKPVIRIDPNTNDEMEFNSIQEAGEYINSSSCHANISACCHGKREKAMGYYWKFKNEIDKLTFKKIKN